MSLHVVVIGAGIVGAASALALLEDGHRVTILDPGPPGGIQAASYGNGCWISPASIIPMSMPGLWKKIPGYLTDPLGPLTIRWQALPSLLPWLVRFVWAGASVSRVERTARHLAELLRDAPGRHRALAARAGMEEMIEQRGLLYLYPSRADFEAEALAWRLRRDNGLAWTELDEDELRQTEPELDRRYRFAVRLDAGGHCVDPGSYVAGLVAYAQSLGAEFVSGRASGFDIRDGRLRAVRIDAGAIACDRAVISAGIASAALAWAAGDKVPLVSERGYHVVVAGPEGSLRTPAMPSDGKMALTPMAQGMRAAGQVELSTTNAAPDWRRADILLRHLQSTLPALPRDIPAERVRRWMGHRPSTPDGLPVVGLSRASADIVYAFGHGHVGLASGPMTGTLVADLIGGRVPGCDVSAFSARRF